MIPMTFIVNRNAITKELAETCYSLLCTQQNQLGHPGPHGKDVKLQLYCPPDVQGPELKLAKQQVARMDFPVRGYRDSLKIWKCITVV